MPDARPLQQLLAQIDTLSVPEVLSLLPEVTALQAALWVRLFHAQHESGLSQPDKLLTVSEAAARLAMSESWLYNNAHILPFTHRMEGALRFSARKLERWLATTRGTAYNGRS